MTTQNPYRSHHAGRLRLNHAGEQVRLSGWIHSLRRFKRQSFIELRETSGLVQLVVPAQLAEGLTEESTISITGLVSERLHPHPNLSAFPTGQVEVHVQTLTVLGAAAQLPFARHESPSEEEMLRHRTLALRWTEHRYPIQARAQIVSAMRQVVQQKEFMEVETPVLVRHTPGGAAPFIVPMGEGKGYALAQSPQLWKQLLVCGGVERYYQLAHCFRNEGSRPERQPEFSQFEIEMAFTTAAEIQEIMEQLVVFSATAVNVNIPSQFSKMTYLEAMARYGSDKPHLGIPLILEGPTATPQTRFSTGIVRLSLPRPLTREEQKRWLGWLWNMVGEQGLVEFPLGNNTFELHGPVEVMQKILGQLRLALAQEWELIEEGVFPLWVEQFPLWEQSPQGWVSAHHPFTRPAPGYEGVWSEPSEMMAEAFDLVINGQEVGGGSMRIHESVLQRRVFSFLGMESGESEENFGCLLRALELGAPPHGGMALGVERLVAVLLGLPNIRAAMAFPKTSSGQCLLTQALGPV